MHSPIGSSAGQLLVACPPLDDPNFDRTVVLMLEHNHMGAIGVVLNRPMAADHVDGLEEWLEQLSEPEVLFSGGPVEQNALIAVGVHGDDWQTVDLSERPNDELEGLRIFVGYSGWAAGQLEAELDAGAWMVLGAHAGDVTTDDPDDLWRAVLRRQGGRIAWLANAPDDLSAN